MDARIALRGARPLQTPLAAPDRFAAPPIAPPLLRPQPCHAIPDAVVIAAMDAASTSLAAAEAFQPRADPAIAVAAAVAAVPPILFWARIVMNEQKRRREADEKERARQELKKKLFGE